MDWFGDGSGGGVGSSEDVKITGHANETEHNANNAIINGLRMLSVHAVGFIGCDTPLAC